MPNNNSSSNKYLVSFFLHDGWEEEYVAAMPSVMEIVEKLFAQGLLMSLALSEDRKSIWSVINADNDSELLHIIDKFKLTVFGDYDYKPLSVYLTAQFLPEVLLN